MKIKVLSTLWTHSKLSIKLSLPVCKEKKAQEITLIIQKRDEKLFKKETKKRP